MVWASWVWRGELGKYGRAVCAWPQERARKGERSIKKSRQRLGEWWREHKRSEELFAFRIIPDATGSLLQTERLICSWFLLLFLFALWASENPLNWCPLLLAALDWWDCHSLLYLSPGFVALASLSTTSAGCEWSSFWVAISSASPL